MSKSFWRGRIFWSLSGVFHGLVLGLAILAGDVPWVLMQIIFIASSAFGFARRLA